MKNVIYKTLTDNIIIKNRDINITNKIIDAYEKGMVGNQIILEEHKLKLIQLLDDVDELNTAVGDFKKLNMEKVWAE